MAPAARRRAAVGASGGFYGPRGNHPGMTLLALAITHKTGIRLAEVGELLGVIGGLALLVGGLTPFGKRIGQTIGGLGIALGFVLLVVATRWGHFH